MSQGITESTIEEIKARIDLAELIASYGIQVKTAGSSKKACCPFHHEKTPSFNINESRGFYHCFGCGESGDAIKFVQKMEGLSFVEAVRKLAEQVGVKIEEKEDPQAGRRKRLFALMAELAQFYRRCLIKSKEGELARKYLVERDLGEKIQEDYLIGYAPSGIATILKWAEKYGYSAEELEAAGVIKAGTRAGDRGYHRFGGRLMFSICDKQGRVVGFSGRQLVASKNSGKYVNSPETILFSKKNILYGFDKAMRAIAQDKKDHEVIVCEGQIDCIRLQTSGFPNAVAGQGTAFTEEHAALLKKVSDLVTLVYDDDGAGHKASIRTARLCLAHEMPVRVVALPGGDDPDSFLRTHSADEFRARIDAAESIMAFQLRAERAKEKDARSVAAVNRITHEMLQTIACCPNAVLKASMVNEAAELLHLPSLALSDELGKIKVQPKMVVEESVDDLHDHAADNLETDACQAGVDAAEILPPPTKEMAFCEFLLANEQADDAKTFEGVLGEFLPAPIFAHDFTRRFVETWRAEIVSGNDLLRTWSEELSASEQAYFARMLVGQQKVLESSAQGLEELHNWVRVLWQEHLLRVRGKLLASGDAEADQLRLQISVDVQRLRSGTWPKVKDLIRKWLTKGVATSVN